MNKFAFILILLCSQFYFSQLTTISVKLWEKAPASASQNTSKCKDADLLNFNCNIKGKKSNTQLKYHKNMSHSIFAVHASMNNEWVWKNQENKVNLGNKKYQKIKQNQNYILDLKPSIYSYVSPRIINDSLQSDSIKLKYEDKNLYEFIFDSKRFTPSKRKITETYLSIKYGISLEKSKYYNSGNKIIWDPGKHKDYRFRPTGIGRDDKNELHQKQSSNQSDLFLTISNGTIKRTNFDNSSSFTNKNFVIWSDNDKDMTLESIGGKSVLKRRWEINFVGDSIAKSGYNLRIKKNIINPSGQITSYWFLLKKADGTFTEIQGLENSENIDFNNINFGVEQADSYFFTFAIGNSSQPEMGKNGIFKDQLQNNDIELDKIELYPNPVRLNNTFTVTFPAMENLSISVFDSGGRMVSTQKIEKTAVKYYRQITTQGLYLVAVIQNGKTIKTFKLIVD